MFRRHSSGNLSDAAQASRLVDRRACFACTSTSVAVLVDKLTVLALHGGVETLVRTSRIDASCHGPRDVAQAHVISTSQVVANLIAILPIIDRALLVYSMVKVLRRALTRRSRVNLIEDQTVLAQHVLVGQCWVERWLLANLFDSTAVCTDAVTVDRLATRVQVDKLSAINWISSPRYSAHIGVSFRHFASYSLCLAGQLLWILRGSHCLGHLFVHRLWLSFGENCTCGGARRGLSL